MEESNDDPSSGSGVVRVNASVRFCSSNLSVVAVDGRCEEMAGFGNASSASNDFLKLSGLSLEVWLAWSSSRDRLAL